MKKAGLPKRPKSKPADEVGTGQQEEQRFTLLRLLYEMAQEEFHICGEQYRCLGCMVGNEHISDIVHYPHCRFTFAREALRLYKEIVGPDDPAIRFLADQQVHTSGAQGGQS